MKKKFGVLGSLILVAATLSFETPVHADEGCALSLDSTLSTYLSTGLEHNLIKHLQLKGYKVHSASPAAYKLAAIAVCAVNGQQAAELPCSETLRLHWTFEDVKAGRVLLQAQEDYSSHWFPVARASKKVHELMKMIPRCSE